MQGIIISFEAATQEGVIRTESGDEFGFDLTGWRGRGLPDQDIWVSFDIDQGRARQVYNLPQGQLKAQGTKKPGSDEVSLPWYKKLGRF